MFHGDLVRKIISITKKGPQKNKHWRKYFLSTSPFSNAAHTHKKVFLAFLFHGQKPQSE
jgi:hypothetical protein